MPLAKYHAGTRDRAADMLASAERIRAVTRRSFGGRGPGADAGALRAVPVRRAYREPVVPQPGEIHGPGWD